MPGCGATAARPSRWCASCAQWRRGAAGLHGDPRFELFELPPHYGAGQETALVAALNGGPAEPTFTPPLPFERDVPGCPTLVQTSRRALVSP